MVPFDVWIASTVLSMVLCAITPHPHVCNVSATLAAQTTGVMLWSYPTNSVCSSSDRAGVADKEVSAVPVPVLVVHATEGWPKNTACKVEAKREREGGSGYTQPRHVDVHTARHAPLSIQATTSSHPEHGPCGRWRQHRHGFRHE